LGSHQTPAYTEAAMTRGQARNTRGPGLECNLRGYQPRGMPAVSTDGAGRRLSYSTTSSDDGRVR